MKKLLTLALCAAAGGLMAAAPLFEKGRSQWKIVIPANASTVNQYAAEEFATAIRKISGVELPVVQSDTVQGENNVVIGSLKDEALIGKKAEELKLKGLEKKNDTIALYTMDGNLYLAGNNPRSAIYAVYHFLREYLGVRWFWPGDDGEYMPERDAFTVPGIAYNYQSPFPYRAASPGGNHGHEMIETGTFRMFTNGERLNRKVADKTGAIRIVGNHSVWMNPRDFEKYPECFSLLNGERRKDGVAGCWSNPQFMKLMVDKHVKWIKDNKADILCAFVADVIQRCECKDCTRLKDKSARWYTFYGKMVDEIRKQCPDIRAATLAYQEYRDIPDMKVEGLEYVEFCLYNRCYIHKMDDPNCSVNAKALAEIKRWQEHAPLGIYGYEFNVFNCDMYVPMHNQFAETAKIFRDMNMIRLKTEYPARLQKKGRGRESAEYIMYRLCTYIFCMTAWNPDLNVDDLIKDFSKYVYGAGGDAMAEYHITMGKYWDAMKIHMTYFLSSPNGCSINLLNPERIAAMQVLLDKAEKAIAAMPDEAARNRAMSDFKVEKYYFDLWVKYFNNTFGKAYILDLPNLPDGSDFDKLPQLPVTALDKKNVARPTDVRMYRSSKGLHFRVILKDAGLKDLYPGTTGRDVDIFQYANVEFFLDLNDGQPYRQMGVCLAGGTYDAIANDDKGWNPDWKAEVKVDKAKDQWSVEVFLPFASLGVEEPSKGTQWKINIIRNRTHKGEATCGFPAPVYRDLDMGAFITF